MVKRALLPYIANSMLIRERRRLGHDADLFAHIDDTVEKQLVGAPVIVQ
ncbi:unnamed protein product, partial [Heterosigma akashiwo]